MAPGVVFSRTVIPADCQIIRSATFVSASQNDVCVPMIGSCGQPRRTKCIGTRVVADGGMYHAAS